MKRKKKFTPVVVSQAKTIRLVQIQVDADDRYSYVCEVLRRDAAGGEAWVEEPNGPNFLGVAQLCRAAQSEMIFTSAPVVSDKSLIALTTLVNISLGACLAALAFVLL